MAEFSRSRTFVTLTLVVRLSDVTDAHESLETFQVNGTQIAHRRIGNGRPLLALNGFAATSADWDPSFIDRLASLAK